MPSSSDQTRVGRTLTLGGGAESSLEGRDIELSVSPKDIRTLPYDLCANRSDRRQSREGDRWFESTSLQDESATNRLLNRPPMGDSRAKTQDSNRRFPTKWTLEAIYNDGAPGHSALRSRGPEAMFLCDLLTSPKTDHAPGDRCGARRSDTTDRCDDQRPVRTGSEGALHNRSVPHARDVVLHQAGCLSKLRTQSVAGAPGRAPARLTSLLAATGGVNTRNAGAPYDSAPSNWSPLIIWCSIRVGACPVPAGPDLRQDSQRRRRQRDPALRCAHRAEAECTREAPDDRQDSERQSPGTAGRKR